MNDAMETEALVAKLNEGTTKETLQLMAEAFQRKTEHAMYPEYAQMLREKEAAGGYWRIGEIQEVQYNDGKWW